MSDQLVRGGAERPEGVERCDFPIGGGFSGGGSRWSYGLKVCCVYQSSFATVAKSGGDVQYTAAGLGLPIEFMRILHLYEVEALTKLIVRKFQDAYC